MARNKKTNLSVTPIMALSMMAIFVMMPVIFGLANNKKTYKKSFAAQPTATPEKNTDTDEPMRLKVTQ